MSAPAPTASHAIDHSDPDRALVSAMRRSGGVFDETLAEAYLNADTAHRFHKALVELRAQADDDNARRLVESFPDLWALYMFDEATRRAMLWRAFQPTFEGFGAAAERERKTQARLPEEDA
jgi:hypothetical protein